MSSLNLVQIIGNLGSDPELRNLSSGKAVCEFRMATNEKWTDKSGQKQERVEWHRVIVWSPQAENCSKYLSKGRSAYVAGRLQTRKWQDKDGHDRYTTEIVAHDVKFLGGGKGDGSRSSSGGGRDDTPDFGGAPDDDIPFAHCGSGEAPHNPGFRACP